MMYNHLLKTFSQMSMAWREGFFYALGDEDESTYDECITHLDSVDVEDFNTGWDTAKGLLAAHTRWLNEGKV